MSVHRRFLGHALSLAQRRKGFCWPNPAVGALVVKDQQILSEGCHHAPGHPHAEFIALRALSYPLTGATLYVTLQPCNHWGKTPPCVDEILRSGVSQVIYAYADPDPRVCDFSLIEHLSSHGIVCHQVETEEIDVFYDSYRHWQQTGTPRVSFKIAQTLNGKVGLPGKRVQISQGDALFHFTHTMRRQSDALLTTANTIIVDRPALNVRLEAQPIAKTVFVIDRKLTAIDYYPALLKTCAQLYVFHDQRLTSPVQKEASINYIGLPADEESHLDFQALLRQVGHVGCHDLWIEAGGRLLSSLLDRSLIHCLYIYISPGILPAASPDVYLGEAAQCPLDYRKISWQVFGDEVVARMTF